MRESRVSGGCCRIKREAQDGRARAWTSWAAWLSFEPSADSGPTAVPFATTPCHCTAVPFAIAVPLVPAATTPMASTIGAVTFIPGIESLLAVSMRAVGGNSICLLKVGAAVSPPRVETARAARPLIARLLARPRSWRRAEGQGHKQGVSTVETLHDKKTVSAGHERGARILPAESGGAAAAAAWRGVGGVGRLT